MPSHGPPGDRHGTGGGGSAGFGGGLFEGFLEQLIPAISSGLYQANIGTQPIRDYFDPVLGLVEREQRQEFGRLLTNYVNPSGASTRKIALGEQYDLQLQRSIDRHEGAFTNIASAFGNVPIAMADILGSIFTKGPELKNPNPGNAQNYDPGRAFSLISQIGTPVEKKRGTGSGTPITPELQARIDKFRRLRQKQIPEGFQGGVLPGFRP